MGEHSQKEGERSSRPARSEEVQGRAQVAAVAQPAKKEKGTSGKKKGEEDDRIAEHAGKKGKSRLMKGNWGVFPSA